MMMFESDFIKKINYTDKEYSDDIKAFDIVYLPGFEIDEEFYG